MRLPGVTRVREPVIYGKLLYRELCIDTDYLDECAAIWATGEYNQLTFESYNNAFKISNVDFLEKFGRVERLRITLDRLVDLTGLQIVQSTLSHLMINDDINFVPDLSKLNNLKKLTVKWDKKTIFPAEMPNLEGLYLGHFSDKSGMLHTLPNAPLLESFGLFQSRKLTSLDGLNRFTKVRELGIAYCPSLTDIEILGELKDLQRIDFENVKNIKSYAVLGKLVKLRKLIITKAAPIADLQWVTELRDLGHLVIREASIEDRDLSPLLLLPNLSHIYLDNKKEYEPIHAELKRIVQSRKAAKNE